MSPSEISSKEPFPKFSGTYALILSLPGTQFIHVGKLGQFEFPAGYYVYVGSAFGAGGLAGRLNRHVRLVQDVGGRKRLHWHIDYLRQHSELTGIWYAGHDSSHEHIWALLVSQLPGATVPVPRFGASDCRCLSHLFHFSTPPDWVTFKQLMQTAFLADF
jgi:Uri superfamily endonuclease